ncbi:hypothetical protein chiPu_0005364 [Chiloscyllium punctatum]|uniref:Uncharacterized protein n=1 Tax=Chiloscyllium punctatum TaxID=137246 RepID=A0A401S993_CHIPU|nr:hypothetical protein [Chiloscyllium punctatum]
MRARIGSSRPQPDLTRPSGGRPERPLRHLCPLNQTCWRAFEKRERVSSPQAPPPAGFGKQDRKPNAPVYPLD